MTRKLSLWIGAVALVALNVACAQSDAGITTEVKAKLEADRSMSSSATIQVETTKKVVTLSGKAASDVEKKRAVAVAKATEGVTGVVDNLAIDPSVAPPEPPPTSGTASSTGSPTTSDTSSPASAPTAAPGK